MKTKQLFASLLCIAAILLLTPRAALANSAPKFWRGADAYGSVVTDAECPITVENELLTFDIPDFPQSYGKNENYNASVTAQYTFFNPADYTVTARLEFPFGTSPHYATSGDDVNKYDITVNGSAIEKTVRHTIKGGGSGNFVLDRDIAKITDGFKEDDFFTPELPVTKYVYEVGDYDESYYNACVAFDFFQSRSSRVFLNDMSDCISLTYGYRLRRHAGYSNKTITLYVFGEQLAAPPEWTFYADRECRAKIDGTVTFISAEKMTFMELARSICPENPENYSALESDWYNAVVDDLNYHSRYSYNSIIDGARVFDTKMANLMRWYEYEITLASGERIVNTVTAPIYPSIDEYMKPAVFKYTYLLSPAQSWADFGDLEIVVNTPFYLHDNSAFEKTETGYKAAFDGLPEGELEFSLSTGKKPVRDVSDGVVSLLVAIVVIVIYVAAIAGVVVIVAAIVRSARRKKR